MLRLQRLKIIQFRNVPPTELLFNDGFNILLGTNASGKTTLLKLIEACVRGDFSPFKEDEFEIDFDIFADGISLKTKITNKKIVFNDTEKQFENHLKPKFLYGYRIKNEDFKCSIEMKFFKKNEKNEIEIGMVSSYTKDKYPEYNIKKNKRIYVFFQKNFMYGRLWFDVRNEIRPLIKIKKPNPNFFTNDDIYSFYLLMAAHDASFRFDESLIFYDRIIGKIDSYSPWFNLKVENSHSSSFLHLIPDMMSLALTMHLDPKIREVDFSQEIVKFSITSLSGFEIIKTAMKVSDAFIEFKFDPNSKSIMNSVWMISDFYFKFGSTEESHRTLSYGQKRLFSFIYYAACNPYIIIADELVNGLHHKWIDACMDLIKDRQCFLTSQNPLLLDCLEFESAEQVQKTFIQCERNDENEDAKIVWSNLKERDAQIFYNAYLGGFQHISEILIVHGMW